MSDKRPEVNSEKTDKSPWEDRYANDGREPIADNPSLIPDRDADIPEGSPGEAANITGEGYQKPSGAAHPDFSSSSNHRETGVRVPRKIEDGA
jgi:hypothetical protein